MILVKNGGLRHRGLSFIRLLIHSQFSSMSVLAIPLDLFRKKKDTVYYECCNYCLFVFLIILSTNEILNSNKKIPIISHRLKKWFLQMSCFILPTI